MVISALIGAYVSSIFTTYPPSIFATSKSVYPPMNDIFNALKYTSREDTRVVILGQDPYHGARQAHGLCFSVKPGVKFPPSLQNIFKELNFGKFAKNTCAYSVQSAIM